MEQEYIQPETTGQPLGMQPDEDIQLNLEQLPQDGTILCARMPLLSESLKSLQNQSILEWDSMELTKDNLTLEQLSCPKTITSCYDICGSMEWKEQPKQYLLVRKSIKNQ